jgi:hypothetical protein
MNFGVFGGFEITRKTNRHGKFDKSFWESIEDQHQGVTEACGCYIFALQNGHNIVSWYVGKTEKRTFRHECFQPTKINYYNECLVDHHGRPLLFILPRLTNSGRKFSKPTNSGYRDIGFLETLLIGMALERNGKLLNIKNTTLLRQMIVPGIINSPRARPAGAVIDLRNALGLSTA